MISGAGCLWLVKFTILVGEKKKKNAIAKGSGLPHHNMQALRPRTVV